MSEYFWHKSSNNLAYKNECVSLIKKSFIGLAYAHSLLLGEKIVKSFAIKWGLPKNLKILNKLLQM